MKGGTPRINSVGGTVGTCNCTCNCQNSLKPRYPWVHFNDIEDTCWSSVIIHSALSFQLYRRHRMARIPCFHNHAILCVLASLCCYDSMRSHYQATEKEGRWWRRWYASGTRGVRGMVSSILILRKQYTCLSVWEAWSWALAPCGMKGIHSAVQHMIARVMPR